MPPREGRHYRYRCFEFWAEKGLISLLDVERAADSTAKLSDYYWRLSPSEFLKRTIAIHIATGVRYPSEIRRTKKLLDDSVEACKLAKAQGDPTDPQVSAYAGRHKRKSRIITPSEANTLLGPVSGGWKFDFDKDRDDVLRTGPAVIPDIIVNPGDDMKKVANLMQGLRRHE